MKTKKKSFAKFITFCVLALFLITNMIFFTSCDNGNSSNDNTNEEQNNTQNTDYCEICDGLQTENCGIKHKCDDENCVEYSDNRIYKNGHTHDYCNEDGCLLDDSVRHTTHDFCPENDCDGSTHMGADHPTTDTSWFNETPIGGEDSPYKVFVIDNNAYNKTHDFTAEEKINDYLDEYIKHINSITLNKELTGDVEINFNKINELGLNYKLDGLIGSLKDESGTIFEGINGINDVCAPAIETITKNIGISGNNALDKQCFTLYYKAISNEIYRMGYNGEITTKTECIGNETEMEQKYIDTKKDCSKYDGYTVLPFENKYFYLENGELNPEVVQQFNKMIIDAATKLQKQNYQVTVDDLHNIISLSFTASSIEGMHDYLSSTLLVNEHKHTDECYNNETVDVIGDVKVDEMTSISQAKLNKSIFSQNYGRELV